MTNLSDRLTLQQLKEALIFGNSAPYVLERGEAEPILWVLPFREF